MFCISPSRICTSHCQVISYIHNCIHIEGFIIHSQSRRENPNKRLMLFVMQFQMIRMDTPCMRAMCVNVQWNFTGLVRMLGHLSLALLYLFQVYVIYFSRVCMTALDCCLPTLQKTKYGDNLRFSCLNDQIGSIGCP